MARQYQRTSPARPAPGIWVIAADAGQARIFRVEHEDGLMSEIEDLINPEAHLQRHEAKSDRNGRVSQGTRSGSNAFEPRESYEQHVAEAFARLLGQKLCEARRDGTVNRIYILAPPGFLGHLRTNLDAPTLRIVAGEVVTDLVRHRPEEIRSALPAAL